MTTSCTRRQLLRRAGLTGVGTWLTGHVSRSAFGSANEKLNVACVGPGNQGKANLGLVAGENSVALCDVDAWRVAIFAKRFPVRSALRNSVFLSTPAGLPDFDSQ